MTVVNQNRTFGVEMEFNKSNTSTTLQELTRRIDIALKFEDFKGCIYHQYTHDIMETWKVVNDGSVSGGECVSPILSIAKNGFRQIEIVTKVIKESGFNVNGTDAGLHIHQDANDLTVRQVGHIFGLYASFQTLISSSLAPSRRRDNDYCATESYRNMRDHTAKSWNNTSTKKLAKTEVRQIADKTRKFSRFSALNIESLSKYGTIEFRQHQGTLNADKIISWVLITQAMIERFVQHNMTWVAPKTQGIDSTKSDWIRFQRALKVTSTATNGQANADVYANAFKFMKANIKKFARTAR